MSLLERARRALEEEHTLQSEIEELRAKAAACGVLLSPSEELERILWPSAVEAALLGCLRCRVIPDRGSLEAAAALVLWLGEAAEKGEKGEKPTPRWISNDEIRDLLARIYLGQKARLTGDGRVEIIDALPAGSSQGEKRCPAVAPRRARWTVGGEPPMPAPNSAHAPAPERPSWAQDRVRSR